VAVWTAEEASLTVAMKRLPPENWECRRQRQSPHFFVLIESRRSVIEEDVDSGNFVAGMNRDRVLLLPQQLKPEKWARLFGMAKAVPFPLSIRAVPLQIVTKGFFEDRERSGTAKVVPFPKDFF
jgi:hypothetical protein